MLGGRSAGGRGVGGEKDGRGKQARGQQQRMSPTGQSQKHIGNLPNEVLILCISFIFSGPGSPVKRPAAGTGAHANSQEAPRAGFEPATLGLEDRCSIQLSYRGMACERRLREASSIDTAV